MVRDSAHVGKDGPVQNVKSTLVKPIHAVAMVLAQGMALALYVNALVVGLAKDAT